MADERISRRERLELTVTALFPAALGILTLPIAAAGRGSWLAPLLALPVGLWLGRLWRELGADGLPAGLERTLGPGLGATVQWVCLLWGWFLLAVSARQFVRRFLAAAPATGSRWLPLAATFALVWYLGRRRKVLARAGRLFYLATAASLALTLVLALPGLRWENLLPLTRTDLGGLPLGALEVLSLAGYGFYGLCLPVERGGEVKPKGWTAWSAGALAVLLFIVTGAFGPALAVELELPFLTLLKGVGLPGAFRRGEAALGAALSLADFALLALLTRGCGELWRRRVPKWENGALWGTGLAFLLGGLLWDGAAADFLARQIAPLGSFILGVGLPAVAVLAGRHEKGSGGAPISCDKTGG